MNPKFLLNRSRCTPDTGVLSARQHCAMGRALPLKRVLQQANTAVDIINGGLTGEALLGGKLLKMVQPDVELPDHGSGGYRIGTAILPALGFQGKGGMLTGEYGNSQVIIITDTVLGGNNIQTFGGVFQLLDHIVQMKETVLWGKLDFRAKNHQAAGIDIIYQGQLIEKDRFKKSRTIQEELGFPHHVLLTDQQLFPQLVGEEDRLHMPEQAAAVGLHEIIQEVLLFQQGLHIRDLGHRSPIPDKRIGRDTVAIDQFFVIGFQQMQFPRKGIAQILHQQAIAYYINVIAFIGMEFIKFIADFFAQADEIAKGTAGDIRPGGNVLHIKKLEHPELGSCRQGV